MRRIGSLAQADFEAMKLGDQMQALCVMYLNKVYFAEEDIALDNLTLEKFLSESQKARDGGPIAQYEFNRQLTKILSGVIPQVMSQPPEEGGA